ncbi:MAG: hypothetical protein ACKPCM_15590, partial [Pseudanabaena sp.]
SPWGTVFSAEENYQNFVPEPVKSDGTSFDPSKKKFTKDDGELVIVVTKTRVANAIAPCRNYIIDKAFR